MGDLLLDGWNAQCNQDEGHENDRDDGGGLEQQQPFSLAGSVRLEVEIDQINEYLDKD